MKARLTPKQCLGLLLALFSAAGGGNVLSAEKALSQSVPSLVFPNVGLVLAEQEGFPVIADIVQGTPAAELSDLRRGLIIIAVAEGGTNGTFVSTKGLSLSAVHSLISGPAGSTVGIRTLADDSIKIARQPSEFALPRIPTRRFLSGISNSDFPALSWITNDSKMAAPKYSESDTVIVRFSETGVQYFAIGLATTRKSTLEAFLRSAVLTTNLQQVRDFLGKRGLENAHLVQGTPGRFDPAATNVLPISDHEWSAISFTKGEKAK